MNERMMQLLEEIQLQLNGIESTLEAIYTKESSDYKNHTRVQNERLEYTQLNAQAQRSQDQMVNTKIMRTTNKSNDILYDWENQMPEIK